MLRAILNKSWRQHPTRRQLYGHLPPITKTIQVRRARHAGHCWRSRDELLVTYSYGPPHMAKQKQDDRPELTYSSYVRTQDVTQKTCRRRWTIGRSGERWSRISVLAVWHDDDDEYISSYKSIHLFFKQSIIFGIFHYTSFFFRTFRKLLRTSRSFKPENRSLQINCSTWKAELNVQAFITDWSTSRTVPLKIIYPLLGL